MSDQNLEYTLDVDIAAAERKLKSLFGDMETSMDILGKAVGKKLRSALTEQEQSAREFGRQLTALDRAVQSNFGLVEKLTDKYSGLGNTRIDGLIRQLESLTNVKISPELQKLMDDRAATPAGMLKSDTKGILGAIEQEAQLHEIVEQSKQDILDKAENERKLMQVREGILDQLAKLEDRTRKYSQDHSQAFAAMRNDVLEFSKALANDVTGGSSSLELSRQQLKSFGDEITTNATIRLNSAKEVAEAEKATAKEVAEAAQNAAREAQAAESQRLKESMDAAEKERQQQRESTELAEQASIKRYQANIRAKDGYKEVKVAADQLDESLRQQERGYTNKGLTAQADSIKKIREELQQLRNSQLSNPVGFSTGENLSQLKQFTAETKKKTEAIVDDMAQAKLSGQADKDLIQKRIKDAKELAVETGKANAEKFGSDQVYRQRIGAIYAQLNSEYDKLMTDSVTMTAEAVSAKIQLIEKQATTEKMIAVNAAQDRAIATAKANASLGRFSSNLYMVQQTVEDFSYAGLRGATNNLAFMASTISGPAGTAAMVGLLGLQFAYSTGMLEKLDKELGVSAGLMSLLGKRTEEAKKQSKEQADYWMALLDAQVEGRKELAKLDLLEFDSTDKRKQKREAESDLRFEREKLENIRSAIGAYKDYQAALEGVSRTTTGGASIKGMFGGLTGDQNELERYLTRYESLARKIAEGKGLAAQDIQQLQQALGSPTAGDGDASGWASSVINAAQAMERFKANAAGQPLSPEGFNALDEAAKRLGTSTDVAARSILNLQLQIDKFKDSEEAVKGFNKTLEDALDFSSQQTDTTGMTSADADIFRDFIDKSKKDLKESADYYKKWIEESPEEFKTNAIDTAREGLDVSSMFIDIKVGELQNTLKLRGEVTESIDKETSAYERYKSAIERAIEKESEHRDSLASQRSAFEDNSTKRQMSALDRIDDLKAGEQKDKLQSQFGYAQDQLQRMKQRDEEIAQQMAQGMGKGGNKWLSNVGNQIDAYYEMLGQKNKNFLTQEMERADQIANTNKQKRLDDLKQQLGGKAQDLTAEAKQAMEGGNLDTASAKLKQAMKTMEELQQAQEKAIGKSSSKQAEQIEKDLKGSSDKIRQLFDMMDEVSKKNTEKLQGDKERALNFMQEMEQKKREVEAIDPYDGGAMDQLQEILDRIKEIGEAKAAISAIPWQAGPALAMGGGGFGGSSTINSTINMNMGGTATPTAAIAAAKAAAASIAMQRA